jgi:hypothetical protein
MGRSARALFSLTIACALACGASRVRAQASCRARLSSEVEAELFRRIEGQARDVACVLEPASSGEPVLATIAIEAQPDGSYEVRVVPQDGKPAHVRQVRPESGASTQGSSELARSAVLEAVALVVRSELAELAAQHEARRARADADRAKAASRAASERTAAASQPAQDDRSRARPAESNEHTAAEGQGNRSAIGLRLALGPELALAESSTLAASITARVLFELGATHGPWLLGAGGSFGLPYTLSDERAALSVRRHTARVYGGRVFTGEASVMTFHALASVLATITRRSTSLRDDSLSPTSATITPSGGVGFEVGLGLRPLHVLAIELSVGLDALLLGVPRFAYATADGERVEHTEPAPLEPRATLLLELRL